MELLIVGLRTLVEQAHLSYKKPDIVRILNMGADHSFIFN